MSGNMHNANVVKFIDLDHSGLQEWKKKSLKLKEDVRCTVIGFSADIMKLLQSMACEVYNDLNNKGGFDHIFVDFSSKKYPHIQPVDLVTIGYEGDMSRYICAQIHEEIYPDLIEDISPQTK